MGRTTRISPSRDDDPNSPTYYPTYGQLVSPRTSYAYDTAGNEITQTDANGNVTNFGYDQNGNQVLQKLPDGESETWTYNLQNQVTGHTDFDGNTATYVYATNGPQAGLLQSVVHAGAPGSGKATQTVTYGYNDLNQQSSVTDASGTTTETYDDFGNLTESNTPEGIIWYAFDPATGNHLETYTANTHVYYGYNIQGRLTTVTMEELNGQGITPLVTTYTYDPAGNKLSESDPNGVAISYGYNTLNELINVRTVTSQTIYVELFTLYDNGLRHTASQSYYTPGGTLEIRTSTTWSYDGDNRLTSEAVIVPIGNGTAGFTQPYTDTYAYDLANNRMSKAHTGPGGGANETTTYGYNGDNELRTQTSSLSGTTNNGYDLNGSLTTSTAGGVTTTYTYDARNKMIGYSSGSVVSAYVYDDSGNRVQETVNGTTTYYLTDTQNPTGYAQPLEAKSSSTATPSTTYFIGDRVFAQADGSATVTYMLPDGHGSTAQLANSSGTVTAVFQYDAFSTALNFTPSSAGTVFLFGRDAVYDRASGTYFHGDGVRLTLGFLFIQRDFGANDSTNADPLSLHTYLYAEANPILKIDPSGHYFAFDDLLASVYIGAGIETGHAIATLEEGEEARRMAKAETSAYEDELEAEMDENALGSSNQAAKNQLPPNESQLQHIFRDAEGHLPDTPENRQLLQDVANDPNSTLGTDQYGNTWSAKKLPDGTQAWAQTRNGRIINGGLNQTPRAFNPQTGLSAPSQPGA